MFAECLAVRLACEDQRRLKGSGSALEGLHDDALYFTFYFYFTLCNIINSALPDVTVNSPDHPDVFCDWKMENGCDHDGIHVDYHSVKQHVSITWRSIDKGSHQNSTNLKIKMCLYCLHVLFRQQWSTENLPIFTQ